MEYTIVHATDPREGVRGGLSSPLVITGYVPMRFGVQVRYEGLNERLFLETLDLSPRIQDVYPQPFYFRFDGVSAKDRRYTPDYLVKYLPHRRLPAFRPMLVEVKTLKELTENKEYFRARFKVASQYCRELGWRFRVVTDAYLSKPYARNARFLYSFTEIVHNPDTASRLKVSLAKQGRMSVIELLERNSGDLEERLTIQPVLWHLVATRQVATSLGSPLNMNSTIWMPNHG